MNRRPSAESDEKPRAAAALSFEASMKRLTEIVEALEKGDLPLEESLKLFEEGVKLSRLSQERLDGAEKRIEQLLAVDDKGEAKTAPFETSANDDSDDGDG